MNKCLIWGGLGDLGVHYTHPLLLGHKFLGMSGFSREHGPIQGHVHNYVGVYKASVMT